MSTGHQPNIVLIVGAGPTGLTLAHELLRRSVQIRLIDKAPNASQNTKALGVWPRTLELFARTSTGIVDEMLERGVKTPSFHVWSEGNLLVHLDFAHRLAGSSYPFALMIPQAETEALLTQHVLSLGGTIERGTELLNLTQQEEGVEVMLRHADGQEEVARTDWLVGCDGAHSMVRHLVGMPFVGKTFEQSFVAGNVRMQWDLPPDEAHAFLHHGNTIAFFPMPDPFHYRVVITYQPAEAPQGEVTLEEVQHAISAFGGPAGARASAPRWLDRFLVDQRRVRRYVSGRVILAGDAAHLHTFVGAQGMNTGMQDAFNLAWKLALVVQGQAKVQLLESYGEEREHVSKELLAATGLAARLATAHQPVLIGVRNFLAPRLTALPLAQRLLIHALAELNISYRHSSIVQDDHARGAGKRAHLHPGDRAPDGHVWTFERNAPHQLFELLSGTRHTLLVFSQQQNGANMKELDLALAEFHDLVDIHQITRGTNGNGAQEGAAGRKLYDPDGSLAHCYGLANEGLVLIRPDGYIGFRSRAIEGEHLRRYLQDLFLTTSSLPLGRE
ncbi:MAG TPA: FAD-dependent monooxygenase [Ktedonobacteraceae bacterium]|nr:FAD-dependent monooxygenase [Ktedonobacteraceae bacterium]